MSAGEWVALTWCLSLTLLAAGITWALYRARKAYRQILGSLDALIRWIGGAP